MIRRALTASLLVATGVLAGYALGGRFRGEAGEAPTGDGRARPPGISALVPVTRPLSAGARQRIDDVWKGRAPAEQMALATAWADVLDPEAIRELLRNIHRLPSNMSQGSAEAVLLNNWLAVEPEAALAWCRQNGKKFVAPMLESWAEKDTEAARAYVLGIGEPEQIDEAAGAVLKVLAARNPEDAFDFLDEIGTRSNRSFYHIAPALTALAREDPQALLARAETYPANMRQKCREVAAKALAHEDPVAALAWWEKQPDRRNFGDSLFRSLAPESWGSALDFLKTLGPEELKNNRSAIFYGWGYQDPARVFALLEGGGGKDGDTLLNDSTGYVSNLLSHWSGKDPGAAADAFLALGKPDGDTALAIARAYARKEPAAARAWAEAIADEQTRLTAIAGLEGGTGEDLKLAPPKSAAELVERMMTGDGNLPDHHLLGLSPEERSQIVTALQEQSPEDATRAAFRILERRDRLSFETAGAMLAALRPTDEESVKQLQEHTGQLTYLWANQVPEEAARWVASLPPGATLTSAASQIASTWNNHDPAAARKWAESLADAKAREAALKALGESR